MLKEVKAKKTRIRLGDRYEKVGGQSAEMVFRRRPSEREIGRRKMTITGMDRGEQYNEETIAFSIYKKMLSDAGILFPLLVIKLPMMANEWVYQNQNKDIERFVTENLKEIWGHLIQSSLTALEFGWAGFEKRWQYDGESNKWRLKKFLDMSPENLSVLVTEDGSFNGLRQSMGGLQQVDIPVEKSFIFTHDKRFGNHYGRSRLKTAYRYWYLDRYCYDYHGIAQQKFAIPPTVAKYPPGVTSIKMQDGTTQKKDNRDLIHEAAQSLINDAVITMPTGDEWDIDTMDVRGRLWDFNADHAHLDKMKARAIFVPDEISIGGGGSYAKAKEHGYWLGLAIEGIMKNLAEEYLEPYVIRHLIFLNFWDGQVQPPLGQFDFEPMNFEAKEFLREIFLKTMEPGTRELGLDYTKIMERYKIPLVGMAEKKEREKAREAAESEKELQKVKQGFAKGIVIDHRHDDGADELPTLTKLEEEIDEWSKERLAKAMDIAESKFMVEASRLFDRAYEKAEPQIKAILQKKDVKALKKLDLAGENEYLVILLELLLTGYQEGLKSAAEDLDLRSYKKEIRAKDNAWIESKIAIIADDQFSDLKNQLALTVINMIRENQTETSILDALKNTVNTFKEKRLMATASVESSIAMNVGRDRLFEEEA